MTVGYIDGAHGTGGELRLRLTTDAPEQLAKITTVWIGDEPGSRRLLGFRMHTDRGLIRIQGIGTPDQGRALQGLPVRIAARDARPLENGEFFYFQLVGLTAVTEGGEPLGAVVDILETGGNDVLVIAPPDGGADLLIPHHRDFVLNVDLEQGQITVRPLNYFN